MLTIYRRHLRNCRHRAKGRKYRHCQCPIWVDGLLGGKEMRESLKLRDWQRAQDLIRQWEAENRRIVQEEKEVTIKEAHAKFIADAEARKLNEATLYKYRLLFRQLDDFAEKNSLRRLKQLDLDTLAMFRATWKDGPRSGLKKLERLRAFLRFTEKRKWIDDNPATDLKAPKVPIKPTMPFTREEMIRILTALGPYGKSAGIRNAQRLRAFVLLLRYSGLRIGDAVQLDVDRIKNAKLLLIACFPRWLLKRSMRLRIRVRAISSGPVSQQSEVPRANGSGDSSGCSNWRSCQPAMRIDSATRSRSNSCLLACRLTGFPCFLGTAAFVSQSVTTLPGHAHGKSRSRPI